MKRYSPGASVKDDYAWICDCCEINDGRATIVWKQLPGRRGHFALCLDCLSALDQIHHPHEIALFEADNTPLIIARTVIPESLRNEVYERDGYKCVKCGNTHDLQLDHKLPFSKGGRTEKNNLQTMCKACNRKKGVSDG